MTERENAMADDRREELEALLARQRAAFTASRPEPLSQRKDRIKRAHESWDGEQDTKIFTKILENG